MKQKYVLAITSLNIYIYHTNLKGHSKYSTITSQSVFGNFAKHSLRPFYANLVLQNDKLLRQEDEAVDLCTVFKSLISQLTPHGHQQVIHRYLKKRRYLTCRQQKKKLMLLRIRLKFLLICRSIGRCCGCHPIPLAGTEIKKGCALASHRNVQPCRGHYFYVNLSDQRNIHEVGFCQVSEAILRVALAVCRRLKVKPHHLQNHVVINMTHTEVM